MRESKLQTQIIKRIKENGGVVYNIHGSAYSSKGTPDLIACIDGKFVAIEVKVGKNKTSPAQKIQIERIKLAGGIAIVPYSIDDFIKELNKNGITKL